MLKRYPSLLRKLKFMKETQHTAGKAPAHLTQRRLYIVLFTVFAISLLACRTKLDSTSDSELRVTNGLEVQADEYPSVVMLRVGEGICSGTFVSDYQLLTAAHCLEDVTRVEIIAIQNWSAIFGPKILASATRWVIHPLYKKGDKAQYDIALVEFPAATSAQWSAIRKERPPLGSTVNVVGYGNNEVNHQIQNDMMQQTGSGIKRVGQNRIFEFKPGTIQLVGSYSQQHAKAGGYGPGQHAGLASGDSGGALFNQSGELIGVASGVNLTTDRNDRILTYLSAFCDLSSESSRVFLKNFEIVKD